MTPEEQKAFIEKVEKYSADLKNVDALTATLKDHAEKVDTILEKITDTSKTASTEAASVEIEKFRTEFKTATDDYVESSKKRQEHIDKLDVEVQKLKQAQNTPFEKVENLSMKIHNIFNDKDHVEAILAKRSRYEVKLEFKAVGNIGAGSITGATTASAQRFQDIPGVIYDPPRPIRMRNLIPVTPTQKDSILWIVESGGEGGAAMVAMAAAKPQFDKDLVRKNYPVEKIAAFARFPEEFADDIPWMQSYLGQRGSDSIMDIEDGQILTGNGTPPNLNGIQTDGAAYVDILADAAVQEWDVLGVAVTQTRNLNYNPSAVLIHPSRLLTMLSLKDTANRYLLPGIFSGVSPAVLGVPIIANTAINSNAFVVGDFRNGATLFQRGGITIRFYEQDADNVTKNLITVVIEERLSLVTERPNAFVISADFDASVAAGQI